MGKLRTGWDWLNHAFTAQALWKLIAPLLAVGALGAYLATLTTFLRMFAPLSYLLAGLVAIALAAIALGFVASLAKRLGWNPERRRPREARHDAELLDVADYIVTESAHGIAKWGGDKANVTTGDLEKEMMDRIGEDELAIWGRIGHWQTTNLRDRNWRSSSISLREGLVKCTGDWGTADYADIQMNWRQVRHAWPRPPLWRRMLTKWQTAKPNSALTAS